ncbi:chemotaxis protein CheW [Roseateles sp.]|uniref:chemotaxis protein CheA n=1 Tax=Roseateles sp. TaxID=1971397 RepID=UPI0039EB75E2
MNIDQALQTFIAESHELLDDMESALLSIGAANPEERSESINAIFRAAHTIKGSAGLFGLDHVVAFTHVAESVLDEVRSGRLELDDALVALLLNCADHMRSLVDVIAAGHNEPDTGLEADGLPLLTALSARLGGSAESSLEADIPTRAAVPASPGCWHLSVRFGPSVLRNGMDPMSFIRYLGTLGRIVRLITVPDSLPAAADMDPECCYLGFEIALEADVDKAAIENVFEFVLDDCELRILPPASLIDEYVTLIRALPEEPFRLGEILASCGSVTLHEIRQALQVQDQSRDGDNEPRRLGDLLVEQGGIQPAVVEAALSQQRKVRDAPGRERQSVRVDAEKLDSLIDLIGELIIAQASASLAARRTVDAELHEAHSTLTALVQAVRDSALQLRMVKIGATFSRFQRVVHDVSREIGKQIDLVISGEETELDKTVVEKIGDPLTHLVRNAMDHGIEIAEVRAARGKPMSGSIRLNAYHDAGSVVIEVEDDGGGLDRERILAKAAERGLIEAGRTLSDTEVFGLIFEPGFSTAEQVTNLSGRGVGMDVVKRNITELRGHVSVASKPGVGTTVTVRLPLTLAIIDGFQIEVGRTVFVVPLESVEECMEYRGGESDWIDLRGEVLPLIRLRQLFEIDGAPPPRRNIVVLRQGRDRLGLVVDTLLGEAQTVIKPLSRVFSQAKGISGSSIRGNGDVVLILDVPALVQQACQRTTHSDSLVA